MEMLLPIMAYFIYSRSQAAPEGRPMQEAIDALSALLRDIRQTVASRRLQAMAEILMVHAAQLTHENVIILDSVMHSLDFFYSETFDIKQFRLRRMRELGLMVTMAFHSSVGVRPHHLIVDSLVRASDVTVAPRERDVAGLFANNVSADADWAQAYSATVQQMQHDFYTRRRRIMGNCCPECSDSAARMTVSLRQRSCSRQSRSCSQSDVNP